MKDGQEKPLLFQVALVCIVVAALVALPIGAELVYRGLNGIEIFPDPEIRPNGLFERYVYSLFRRSDNDVLFYEPNPNAEFSKYKINSSGFRGREYSIEKPANTFRIVILGDSIVWGHELAESETIAGQLERSLNEMGKAMQFEVLNFGVSGYSTQQEVELFVESAQKFDPDFVIVGFCLNDFEESSVEAGPFRKITQGMTSKSYLLEAVNREFYHFARRYLEFSPRPSFVLKIVDIRKEFERLQNHVGSRILLLIFPTLAGFENYSLAHLHADVKNSVDGLNFDTIDLFEAFLPYAPEELKVSPKDLTHPNAFANSIVTEQIILYLRRVFEERRIL